MSGLLTQLFGERGERAAERYIRRHGGKVVARNWRCKRGEVDLVVIEGDTLAFVEVKARESEQFGRPLEYVQRDKRRRIEALAQEFCRRRRVEPDTIRFDVVEIIGREHPRVNWVRGVWLAGE